MARSSTMEKKKYREKGEDGENIPHRMLLISLRSSRYALLGRYTPADTVKMTLM